MAKNKINALILDMDGVIWRDRQPIGNLANIFNRIEQKGIKYVFATNNSTSTVDKYVEDLMELGISAKYKQIYTSATTTARYLQSQHPNGGNVYVVGMDGLKKTLEKYGFTASNKYPIAVVVGMDLNLTYDKLRTATLLIRGGVPFIGTNPDKTFPSPEGFVPGAGSMLAAIQAATGQAPDIMGKPKATMFLQAMEHLGENPREVLVVGDRLETDIAGGQAANCRCALVLTGVSSQKMGEAWKPKIDYIVDDLETLIELL